VTTAVASTAGPDDQVYDEAFGAHWWIFLITGTAWLFFALILFRFNITSAKSIGILAGIVFLIAGLFEFAMTAVVKGGWWKALNAILGVLLVVGGILSFIHPSNAFVAVASITGFMFLFVGILDVIVALADRRGVWWVRLVVGIACILLGFWASGDFSRSATLLVAWVGAFALLRGINSFLIAFALRGAHKELTSG
jgi:uncharacterized membrane protein HdeD (DUF308 family)